MQLFIVDAFTNKLFGGNQAGVVLLNDTDSFPDDIVMQKIAAELKHSETAFAKQTSENAYRLRYFTPEGEVDLCGHATISVFTVLREEAWIGTGRFMAQTAAGSLRVEVEPDSVWLEMPRGNLVRYLTGQESNELYRAFRLDLSDRPETLQPAIVRVGLADILLPVKSKDRLDGAIQNRDEIIRLSKEIQVVGVHLFYCPPDAQTTAYCRNFAPLFGIDEESATGTSNASLTYYLDQHRMLPKESSNVFVQGEAMGRPSVIYSKTDSTGSIHIGGSAVISVRGSLNLQ
jgi:PhzF family phenazine biosynthesis protein